MTLGGAVTKTFLLVVTLLMTAVWAWQTASQPTGQPAWFGPALTFGWILPMLLLGVMRFFPTMSPWLALPFAAAKGLVVGIMSFGVARGAAGMVLTAVLLSGGVLLALLGAYKTGIIKPTQNLRLGVFAATGGVMLFYLVSWVLNTFFHIQVPGLFSNGWLGIAFSAFVIILSALNLVFDFDFIENGAAQGAPKYMEWYAGVGLLVTLVWLYIEILRMLAKLQSRRD
jgi:uncharacterized YccA/Bax inhibitor family protein